MGIESSANRGPIGLPQPLLSRKFGSQELYNISRCYWRQELHTEIGMYGIDFHFLYKAETS